MIAVLLICALVSCVLDHRNLFRASVKGWTWVSLSCTGISDLPFFARSAGASRIALCQELSLLPTGKNLGSIERLDPTGGLARQVVRYLDQAQVFLRYLPPH